MFPFFKKSKIKRIGLALGGGAARGIAHIGVLKAFQRYHIPIHCIAGTSAGSVIGALYAAGIDPVEMERAVKELSLLNVIFPSFSLEGLNDSEIIARTLKSYLENKTFADLHIPFVAIATDLKTGEEARFHKGEVSTAIRASSSIPVIYTPTHIGRHVYIDGAFSNNVPVQAVLDMGADFVIAVDVIPRVILQEDPNDAVGIYSRAQDILLKHAVRRELQKADIMIEPIQENILSFELKDQERLIELGEKATEKVIPELKRKL